MGTKNVRSCWRSPAEDIAVFVLLPKGFRSYSVLPFCGKYNKDTAEFFQGKDRVEKDRMLFSPDKCITNRTPPAFLWHTMTDEKGHYEASIRFARTMAAHARPCELRLFPLGNHGMLLGLNTPDISIWPTHAKHFIKVQERQSPALKKCYTNQYQCAAEKTYPGPEKQQK